jgi:signal peptidase II
LNRPHGPATGLSIALVLLALGLDRIHKYIQLDLFGWGEQCQIGGFGCPRVPVTPFFDYLLVWNTGISYGLFSAVPIWAVGLLITIALVLLLGWWWRSTSALVRTGLALALGGGISNMLDRLLFGAVADFFYLHAGEVGFYVFNIADLAISAGLVLLVIDLLIPRRHTEP